MGEVFSRAIRDRESGNLKSGNRKACIARCQVNAHVRWLGGPDPKLVIWAPEKTRSCHPDRVSFRHEVSWNRIRVPGVYLVWTKCSEMTLANAFRRYTLGIILFACGCAVAQCPPRQRMPDPPGWAIDTIGPHSITGKQLSPDGKWLAFQADGATWLVDISEKTRRVLVPCIEVSSDALAFSADSSLLAQGAGDGQIYLFDVRSGALTKEFRDQDWVQRLEFGPQGLLLASRSDGLSIWDWKTGKQVADFDDGACSEGGPCVREFMDDVAVSDDGKLVATNGREDSGTVVRDLSGHVVAWFTGPDGSGFLHFKPGDPNLLIVETARGFVYWDVTGKKVMRRVPNPNNLVIHSFVPGQDSRIIAANYEHGFCFACSPSSDEQHDIRVREGDIETGKVLRSWPSLRDYNALTPDGKWALRGDPMEVWYLPTHTLVGTFKYEPSAAIAPKWNVKADYLAARVYKERPTLGLVYLLFTSWGCIAFLAIRRSRSAGTLAITMGLALSGWWLWELFGKAYAPAQLGRTAYPYLAAAALAIAPGCVIPAVALTNLGKRVSWRGWRFYLSIAFCQVVFAGLLILVAAAQQKTDHARLQVQSDVRAGGELRGSAMLPWWYIPTPYQFGEALNAPVTPVLTLSCAVTYREQIGNKTAVYATGLATVFLFWLLAGGLIGSREHPKFSMVSGAVVFLLSGAAAFGTIATCWRWPLYLSAMWPLMLGAIVWAALSLVVAIRAYRFRVIAQTSSI